MKILNKKEILDKLPKKNIIIDLIRQCYIDYSEKSYTVPPVGHLPLPNGELHIKYGISNKLDYAVIKIASGSYTNKEIGLPNSYGCSMVINSNTGFPEYLLQDEGILTDHRTAAAGGLMSKTVAGDIKDINFGIVGCGIQGYFQSIYTCYALGINKLFAYDINLENISMLSKQLSDHNIELIPCDSIKELCGFCDIITTVTPANRGYINHEWLKENAHINAFGCDTKGKQELTEGVMQKASLIFADSISQCADHGELQYTYNDKHQNNIKQKVIEIGVYLKDSSKYSTKGITIADFTGIAPQDIAIANAIIE